MVRLSFRSLIMMVVGSASMTSLLAQPSDPPASGKYWIYVGTYTAKNGSKGIYRAELDAKTGKLSEPEVAAEVGSPSFVAISPDGKSLYAVGETTGNKQEGGGVYSFRIDAASGKLTKLNNQTSGGAGPCHISTDSSGKFAVVANYGGGSCAFYKLKSDGSFESRTTVIQHKGKSSNPKRQEAPHAHSGFFDKTGKFAFVVDLGLDQVLIYKINAETGEATPNDPAFVKMPAGSGPRHIHIAPSNDLAFVCGELDSTVNVVKMDLSSNKFEVVQSESTLPGGKPVPGNSTAEVRIHPNGKFVYVSNRGHNSIAAFAWDGKKLTPIGHATEGIKVPRNFNIDPTGRWMLVCNQSGNDVIVFEIGADGLPKPTGNKIAVSQPVCVKFLAKP